jgi:hypothetical protein
LANIDPKLKIPLVLGAIGIAIGFVFMAAYFYELQYNPFHFPTYEEQVALGGYSPPPLYNFLEGLMFTLVPGLWLQPAGIDGWVAVVLWVVAVLLNGPIYFGAGALLLVLIRRVPGGAPLPR